MNSSIMNPRHFPAYILTLSIAVLGIAGWASTHRIRQSIAESSDAQIAAQRAESCRVLGGSDAVVLGRYYFQPSIVLPNGSITGQYLPEGTYICDLFGVTARIERGGFAQFVVRGSQEEINKTLQRRLADSTNPDSNLASRPRDAGIEPHKGTGEDDKQNSFFKL